jgi:hypothetical protein
MIYIVIHPVLTISALGLEYPCSLKGGAHHLVKYGISFAAHPLSYLWNCNPVLCIVVIHADGWRDYTLLKVQG